LGELKVFRGEIIYFFSGRFQYHSENHEDLLMLELLRWIFERPGGIFDIFRSDLEFYRLFDRFQEFGCQEPDKAPQNLCSFQCNAV